MLKDRKRTVERNAFELVRKRRLVPLYATFLRTLFSLGDWFVTLTFRDRHPDFESKPTDSFYVSRKTRNRKGVKPPPWNNQINKIPADPILKAWQPDSKWRPKPGPPVRDAALREIDHWLLELGWEASGHKRQEIFDRLADGLEGKERRAFAMRLCRRCLCCEVLKDPVTFSFYYEIEKTATKAIGWVIAEELGRVGGVGTYIC